MSSIATTQPVLVTGANGFIASHLVKQLLEKGYSVRGTVRKIEENKVKHLRDFDYAADRLKLFEANLVDSGSFDEAANGVEYIFHTASPYALQVDDPQKDLVDPAVQGTLTILESAVKAGTVKRVILTSSMASITDSPQEGHVYTEADWNTSSSLTRNPYYYSKVMAERAAWDFVEKLPKEKKFELVVINPFIVIGPSLSIGDTQNVSNQIIIDLMTGKYPGILNIGWGMVDVRDVATAHILAMENPKAEGRFIVANISIWMATLVEKLQAKYPGYNYPRLDLDCKVGSFVVRFASYFQGQGVGSYLRTNLGVLPVFDHSKAVSDQLGLKFRDFDETLDDLINFFIDGGVLKK